MQRGFRKHPTIAYTKIISGYMAPREYTGNAKLTPLGHSVNATHFTLTYHCEGQVSKLCRIELF
jgi:hypothetical protein